MAKETTSTPGFLHAAGCRMITDFAMRWWKEPGQHSRVQIVFFFTRGGKVNLTMGHSHARLWLKDLTAAMADGDAYHYFIFDVEQPGFVLNRSRFVEFRNKLMRLLDLGPAATPFKGFASDSMPTIAMGSVQVESIQKTRWV